MKGRKRNPVTGNSQLPLINSAGVRDVDAPCGQFTPGHRTYRSDCLGDGHYLCKSCQHLVMDESSQEDQEEEKS